MARLTDCPAMNITIDWDVKQQQQKKTEEIYCFALRDEINIIFIPKILYMLYLLPSSALSQSDSP